MIVSTRSRPKAAGSDEHEECEDRRRFNTQPPEGGWMPLPFAAAPNVRFQHAAAQRRLGRKRDGVQIRHLRFNTQPPEGGWNKIFLIFFDMFCFNTQPPEGGWEC